MATSSFRRQNLQRIQVQVNDLISHVTQLQPADDNFTIAEDFIMGNIQNNSFQDTNENDVRRMIANLAQKQIVHNQPERAARFKYLVQSFKDKPMKQEGISDAHMSMIHLLFLLADNPVGPGGFIDDGVRGQLSDKVYLTKAEAEEQHKHLVEDQIRAIQQELKADMAGEVDKDDDQEDASFSSEDFDDHDEEQQPTYDGGLDVPQSMQARFQTVGQHRAPKPLSPKKRREVRLQSNKGGASEFDGKPRNTQMFFGGLPLSAKGASMLVDEKPTMQRLQFIKQRRAERPKKFSTEAFLDLYMQEKKQALNTFAEVERQIAQERATQSQLKQVLGIRTFDQIQQELSKRLAEQAQLEQQTAEKSAKQMKESDNPQESSYREPLNLLSQFKENIDKVYCYHSHTIDDKGQPLWAFTHITERQAVLDCVQLLLGLETPCFERVYNPFNQQAKTFKIRKPVQVLHLSPNALNSMLGKFLKVAGVFHGLEFFLNGLKKEKKLGTVIESLVFKTTQVMDRVTAQLSDFQLICLYQAGQISKQQLQLSTESLLGDVVDQPMTLLRVYDLIEARLLSQVQTLHSLLANGIMDFLVAQKERGEQDEERRILVNSIFSPLHQRRDESAEAAQRATEYTGQLKDECADLDPEKIKPADRVTFLLNYIYLVLKNNLFAWSSCAKQISLLREIFIAVLDPYIQILSLWVSNGELNDPYDEFFIKVNPKLLNQQEESATARQQWEKSFKFRSINLREFEDRLFGMGNDGEFLVSNKIEISIPIFLREHIQQILSIGKSIKVIRFIESEQNQNKSGRAAMSLPTNFYARYSKQISQLVNDPAKEVDTTGAHLASQELATAWNARRFEVCDNLQNAQALSLKQQLGMAPFGWNVETQSGGGPSTNPSPGGFMSLFSMPAISETPTEPSTQRESLPQLPACEDETMQIDQKASIDMADKSESAVSIIGAEKLQKLSRAFNFNQQELSQGYQTSMTCYADDRAYQHLTENTLRGAQSEAESSALLTMNDVSSIVDFVNQAVISELVQSEKIAGRIFLTQMQTYCKLLEHLQLVHNVFFMEAGHHMHAFAVELFDDLDAGIAIDNRVLLNAHFQNSIEGIARKDFSSQELRNKLSVEFADNPSKYQTDTLHGLDYLAIVFRSDWPLEIIFDKQTMTCYSAVFRFLMRIKRVNYMISQKDFWVRMRVPKDTSYMNVQEQLIVKNKAEFNKLVHKMQIFQREIQHFVSNMEFYIKNSALKKCCQELDAKLKGLQMPDFAPGKQDEDDDQNDSQEKRSIDMDELIKLHKNFQNQVLRRCMLDKTLNSLRKELNNAMENVLSFRRICKKFFLCKVPGEVIDSDEEMMGEEGRGREISGPRGPRRRKFEQEGMGLLRVGSSDFMTNLRACTQEMTNVRQRFKHTMQIIMRGLSITENASNETKFLGEAFIRFNFNYYYHTEGGQRRV